MAGTLYLSVCLMLHSVQCVGEVCIVKVKGSSYSIAECTVPELIPVLGSQPAGDVSHKPSSRLPLLSARLKRAAISFAAW